jgi:hypothetical protein
MSITATRIKAPTDKHPRRAWNSPERQRRRDRQKKSGTKGRQAGIQGMTHKGKSTQTIRDTLKTIRPRNWRNLHERLGGSEKAKPHSTKEGRVASGKRKMKRVFQDANKPKPPTKPKHTLPKWKVQPKHVPAKRVAKAAGGIAKAGKRFLDFIKTGKHVDKHGVKTNVPKAAERITGKPHVDHGKRKKIKKAEGGRIGLKKGSVHKPGSHSWYLQHMNKNKKASGGRANFRHGGSVGAAIKGHGAEIK